MSSQGIRGSKHGSGKRKKIFHGERSFGTLQTISETGCRTSFRHGCAMTGGSKPTLSTPPSRSLRRRTPVSQPSQRQRRRSVLPCPCRAVWPDLPHGQRRRTPRRMAVHPAARLARRECHGRGGDPRSIGGPRPRTRPTLRPRHAGPRRHSRHASPGDRGHRRARHDRRSQHDRRRLRPDRRLGALRKPSEGRRMRRPYTARPHSTST